MDRDTTRDKTDADVLREAHRFIRNADDDDESTYEKRLAKRYYDKLFKEYCLSDLRRYRQNQVGLRWRTQAEVFAGKGQFVCGSLHCDEREKLRSYEVEFRYVEAGERKAALVKIRLCPECSFRLNYKHYKRIARERREAAKQAKRNERRAARDAKRDSKRQKQTSWKPSRDHESSSSSSSLSDDNTDDDDNDDDEWIESTRDTIRDDVEKQVAIDAEQRRTNQTSSTATTTNKNNNNNGNEFQDLFL